MTRQRTESEEETSSRLIADNQVHVDYASVENEDGVTFSSGNMLVYGMAQIPIEAEN